MLSKFGTTIFEGSPLHTTVLADSQIEFTWGELKRKNNYFLFTGNYLTDCVWSFGFFEKTLDFLQNAQLHL